MLTVEEVAAILKVQPLTVRQMFREGRIRGFKIGKAWRTTMPILEEDIACMSRGVKPPRLEEQGGGASASPSSETVPVRKRRVKAEPTADTGVEEPVAAPLAAVEEAAPAAVPPTESAPPEVPAPAEEADAGGRRKRKSPPEENTDQQLLF